MSSEMLFDVHELQEAVQALTRKVCNLGDLADDAAMAFELRRELKRAPVATSPRAAIYSAIDAERAWQNEHHIWPADQRDAERLAILVEEVGEVAHAICEVMQGGPDDPRATPRRAGPGRRRGHQVA